MALCVSSSISRRVCVLRQRLTECDAPNGGDGVASQWTSALRWLLSVTAFARDAKAADGGGGAAASIMGVL